MVYLHTANPDQGAAIVWLSAYLGQPTIASVPVPEHRLYEFNARPTASLTGIFALVGWNHETDYLERVVAVDTI